MGGAEPDDSHPAGLMISRTAGRASNFVQLPRFP